MYFENRFEKSKINNVYSKQKKPPSHVFYVNRRTFWRIICSNKQI